MAVLEVKNLGIAFGGLRALQDVQFTIGEKEIIGLIGPNGAGKTTVFNLLTDVYVPTEGTITLENQNIVGKKTYQITQGGISRTFQNIRLFKDISVIDNVDCDEFPDEILCLIGNLPHAEIPPGRAADRSEGT